MLSPSFTGATTAPSQSVPSQSNPSERISGAPTICGSLFSQSTGSNLQKGGETTASTTGNSTSSQQASIFASPFMGQASGTASSQDNKAQNVSIFSSPFTHQTAASTSRDNTASQTARSAAASAGTLPVNDSSLPKLLHEGYYMKPGLDELAAIERSQTGFCSRVMGFTVGRHGCGSIKFEGETDVRGLELDSLITITDREVSVNEKLPSAVLINKAAEVTLLNFKCICKDTGAQHILGTRVSQYTEKLKKAIQDQGAQFLSYDPVKGECKFRVTHFPRHKGGSYKLHVEFGS
ncbi:hypothetical protein Droror1_Dr00022207 [Drosera rotundifolia]